MCVCEKPYSLINTEVGKEDLGLYSSYASEGPRERENITLNRHFGTAHTYRIIGNTVQYICTE